MNKVLKWCTAIAVIAVLAGCNTAPIKPVSISDSTKPFFAKASAAESFASLATADLAQATAVAAANNDTAGMSCYPVLSQFVTQCQTAASPPLAKPTPIAAPTPCDGACQFEVLRINTNMAAAYMRAAVGQVNTVVSCWKNVLLNGVPSSLLNACAAVAMDPLDLADNLANKVTGVAPLPALK